MSGAWTDLPGADPAADMTTRITAALLFLCCAVASPALAQSVPVDIHVLCPDLKDAIAAGARIPSSALRQGILSGEVDVAFTVAADGRVTDVHAENATHPVFEPGAVAPIEKLRCRGDGQEHRFRMPFSYRMELDGGYAPSREDIPVSRLADVVPRIAELRVEPKRFTLHVGDGVRIDTLKVMAYDRDGQSLGRLRQFDREALPKDVLTMRGAGIVQVIAAGAGYLELTAPKFAAKDANGPRASVRVDIDGVP